MLDEPHDCGWTVAAVGFTSAGQTHEDVDSTACCLATHAHGCRCRRHLWQEASSEHGPSWTLSHAHGSFVLPHVHCPSRHEHLITSTCVTMSHQHMSPCGSSALPMQPGQGTERTQPALCSAAVGAHEVQAPHIRNHIYGQAKSNLEPFSADQVVALNVHRCNPVN